MAPESLVRRMVTVVESIPDSAGGLSCQRAAAIAILVNPLAGEYEEDLTELNVLGGQIAGQLLSALSSCAGPTDALAIGRAAAVGQDGEIEHASALIGPGFTAAVVAALFATEPEPPSTRARIKSGGPVVVAFQTRDGSNAHLAPPAWRLTVDGSPADDEAVVVLALYGPTDRKL